MNYHLEFKMQEKSISMKNSASIAKAELSTLAKVQTLDIDDINERLCRGDKGAVKELEANKIPYTLSETDGGYQIKYSYNGANYTITYYAPPAVEEPEQDSATETTDDEKIDISINDSFNPETVECAQVFKKELLQNAYGFTTEQIEKYFEYVDVENGVLHVIGWQLKTGQEVNGVTINSLEDLLRALDMKDPTEPAQVFEKELLQNAYGFTTEQIEKYFEYVDVANGVLHVIGWQLKTGQEVNGVTINSLEDLLRALDMEDPTKYNPNAGETTEVPETPDKPEAPEEPYFDYSGVGVDKDAKAEDFYNKDNISSDKKLTMLLGSKGDVDSGAWDDLFAELEKMKPQLMDYMKQQLESVGRVYDEEKAEKIINRLITQAVERIPQDGVAWSYSLSGIGDPASNRLPEKPTIEDLMNYMKNCLDLTPDKEGNGVFAQLINTVSTGYERDFERKADDGKLKINSYSPYYEEDGYLLDTADYFLTDEEKEMKFVMKVTDNEYSSYGTSDKTKLFGYIDTYAKHLEKVIRHRHPSLSDTQITSIMTDAKNKVKYSDLPKPNENGIYSIDDTLAKLEELVLKYADEYTK